MDPTDQDLAGSLKEPLVFESFLRPQVWGGRRLASALGKTLPDAQPYGESWEICGLPDQPSTVADGPFRGRNLIDLWTCHAPDLIGTTAPPPDFPLFVKWLDCHDRLSVQVHPDDDLAGELLGQSVGKSEAWVVVDAAPTAKVYAGLRDGVTRSDFESQLKAGRVVDCLHSFTPKAGDCISLPAGTIHSAQGDILIAEVQQSSHATFRLFDWNRRDASGQQRELHHDRALRAIHWPQGPIVPTVPRNLTDDQPGATGEMLLQTHLFEIRRYRIHDEWRAPHRQTLTIWMVLEGAAKIASSECRPPQVFPAGSTILVPAASTQIQWSPVSNNAVCTLLCISPPPGNGVPAIRSLIAEDASH
jgi:mannose-6-phosphate isomerase